MDFVALRKPASVSVGALVVPTAPSTLDKALSVVGGPNFGAAIAVATVAAAGAGVLASGVLMGVVAGGAMNVLGRALTTQYCNGNVNDRCGSYAKAAGASDGYRDALADKGAGKTKFAGRGLSSDPTFALAARTSGSPVDYLESYDSTYSQWFDAK